MSDHDRNAVTERSQDSRMAHSVLDMGPDERLSRLWTGTQRWCWEPRVALSLKPFVCTTRFKGGVRHDRSSVGKSRS